MTNPEEQGRVTASEEREMVAKQAEDRATRIRHGVPSVSWDLKGEEQKRIAANALVSFAHEIRDGKHANGASHEEQR